MDDAGDQKTGNDKEDVDADEPAGNQLRKGVVEQHWQDGHRAQTVDILAIAQRRGMRLFESQTGLCDIHRCRLQLCVSAKREVEYFSRK